METEKQMEENTHRTTWETEREELPEIVAADLAIRKRKRMFYDGMLIVGIILLIAAFVYFYFFYKDYRDAMKEYDDIAQEFTFVPAESPIDTLTSGAEHDADSEQEPEESEELEEPEAEEENQETAPEDAVQSEEIHHIDYQRGNISKLRYKESREILWYQMMSVNISGLRQRNAEVQGWLYFEQGDISYPIMQGSDNEKYLNVTMSGAASKAGSIFMDFENAPDFTDSRTVIYGHNMRNLSMFGKLRYYKKPGYYEDNRYFQIFTADRIYRYEIFSYFEIADTEVDMVLTNYEADDEFPLFINHLKNKSYRAVRVNTDKNSRIVSLITCSSTGRRFMVNAVMIDSYAR